MPTADGMLTPQEIEVLKGDRKALLAMDEQFKRMERAGIDIKESKSERDTALKRIEQLLLACDRDWETSIS